MTKIINLVPPEKETSVTYIQALQNHINMLTDAQANCIVDQLMICGNTDIGAVYSILEGGDPLKIMGLLGVAQHIFADSTLYPDNGLD